MKKQIFYAASLVLAFGLSSCNKNMNALDEKNFECTPNPLVVKGGKVDATITGTFPEKYFTKKAIVTVTPVLKYEGKQTESTASKFQGEKVTDNNQVISYKTGGKYSMKASFPYTPEMAKSELYLTFDVVVKDKKYQIKAVKVADGVIATAQLVGCNSQEIAPVIIADKFQRVIQEKQTADIKFLIQQSTLRKSEMKSEDVVTLIKNIKNLQGVENKKVSNFEISGYASPDGGMNLNTNLAEKREDVTAKFISKEMKKIKTSVKIDSKFTAEDWAGFQDLMEKSNIQDKQLILRVLSMYSDPEQREREIKNISVAFKAIAEEILPQLRRSRLNVTVDVTGKSDAELTKLAKEDPAKLNVEELLFAATLSNNLNEKAAIYQKSTELFSTDARTFNNLGAVQMQQGNTADAARNFAKALSLDSKNADINFNSGAAALAKGDIAKAEEFLGNAAGTQGNLGQALGSVNIVKGDYSKASSYFGSSVSNNAALLQILNADYNGARKTLSAVAQPNATTSYLGAIVGARTNDRDAVFSNLKAAVKQDSSLAAKASKDIEFAKFATDETFINIIK